jgi:CheY-like chemotaxis protein
MEKSTNQSENKSLHILVVEDTIELNKLICMMVNKADNMLAEGVLGGREALEALSEESYDAILLDINMPGMSGLETLKYIRLRDENIPVVMCTAQTHSSDIEDAFERGADDYLVKPIQKEILWHTLKRALMVSQQLSSGEKREKKRSENKEIVLNKVAGKGIHQKERFKIIFRVNNEGDPVGQKLFGEGVGLDCIGFRLKCKHSLEGIDSITFALDRGDGSNLMLVGIANINHTGFDGKDSVFRVKFVSVRKTG